MFSPSEPLKDRISRLLGARPDNFQKVVGGYTPAERWTFTCARGQFFAKVGATPLTASLLRREAVAYQTMSGSVMPALVGWDDTENHPLLVIEDLSRAAWPPPWNTARVEAVLKSLAELHTTRAVLPGYAEVHGARGGNWQAVADEPRPFLALGLVTEDWLAHSLPTLLEAESKCTTEGDCATHWDVRSDNLCFKSNGAVLVDWAEACLSNPALDLGFWLPSLAHEGGPAPEVVLPRRPDVAAWVNGFFAARAGLPLIPMRPACAWCNFSSLRLLCPGR
jgi:hypothetical protein